MTTREELDAALAEFDRRRAAADAVLSGWSQTDRPAEHDQHDGPHGVRSRPIGRLGRWLGRTA